jgi:hypothetical protein
VFFLVEAIITTDARFVKGMANAKNGIISGYGSGPKGVGKGGLAWEGCTKGLVNDFRVTHACFLQAAGKG